jgi:hypothetical protein
MPHYPSKKQMIEGHHQGVVAIDNDFSPSFDDLGVDVLPNILGYLILKDIMRSRRINKKTMQAVRNTIVPPTHFRVGNVDEFNAMNVMTRALPNLQQITIRGLGLRHKYNDGDDPTEYWATQTADYTSYDIGIISNFSKLRILYINSARLNGRYPFLFNSFPLLQKLIIKNSCYNLIDLKWDLGMLAGMPLLKELDCDNNDHLTGNISSLRVLKDTLEKVDIKCCWSVEGNFMELSDFPFLKELNLDNTAVTGDIRDIDDNDFLTLEQLFLPKGVYGCHGYEFQRISDGPDVARAVYLLKKQRPALEMGYWCVYLSRDSPDWYESADEDDDTPPFYIQFVKAGPRLGYRWETDDGNPCKVNWLDPEPDRESSHYEEYMKELQRIDRGFYYYRGLYRGFHQPPTQEQYTLLYEEYLAEIQSDDEDY